MESSLCMVLKAVDYRDNDKILTLFSREKGKLTVMATGVKNIKNELSAAAQPLCCGIFSYANVKGKYYLKQCEIKKSYIALASDYDAYFAACSIIDFLDRLLSDIDDFNEIFILAVNCIDALQRKVPPCEVMGYFAVKILDILGLNPDMQNCVLCGSEIEKAKYFSTEEGGAVCPTCAQHIKTQAINEDFACAVFEMQETRPIDFAGDNRINARNLEILKEYVKIMTEISLKTV